MRNENPVEKAIRDAAGKPEGELTEEDLLGIQELRLESLDISDLQPFLSFRLPALKLLDLGWNYGIHDLSPLATMVSLESLNLLHSLEDGTDLSPLVNLTVLRDLSLGTFEGRDFSPLHALKSLQSLYLENNGMALPDDPGQITQAEIEELELALPDCKIELSQG